MSSAWRPHETKRTLRGHLHHELCPPAVVLVCHFLQTLDHLPEGGNQVEAPPWLQERTHCLEVQHGGIEHHEMVSARNKAHAEQVNWEHCIIYMMHMQAISSQLNSDQTSTLNAKVLWFANECGFTTVQWATGEHPLWAILCEISEIY